MGAYEYESDPHEQWNDAFEADPASAAYRMAQAAIAEHAAANQQSYDEQKVAAQAAQLLAQQQAQQAAERQSFEIGKAVDRSMTAAHGAKYAALAGKVAERLPSEPGYETTNFNDANSVLQFVDGVYQKVAQESDPSVQEWSRIRAAGKGSYYEGGS